jgi:beta-glucosidase/6-phospho-beta-glucosidase/beta-galactosidase
MIKNQFPNNFFWGAATSSYQIEGNQHNDWTKWGKKSADRLAVAAPKQFQTTAPRWEEIKAEATDPTPWLALPAPHWQLTAIKINF